MRRARFGALPSLALALLIGCGGGAEPSERAGGRADSAGGEAQARAPRPSGPPMSYLPQGTKVVARLDMSRVRRSPLGPDIASAIRATETWQRLAGSSGLDPVRDFDAILVGADAIYTHRRVVVLRTPHTEAEVRQRVLALAIDRGAPPEWREVGGLSVISWPMPRVDVPYSLVLTAPHELVLAPDDDLARIAEVASDHALRRAQGSDAPIEPELVAMREREIATVSVGVPLPGREGYPQPPDRTRIEVDESETGDAVIAIHTEFTDEARASAAHAWLLEQARYWAGQTMVRAIGMNRPLEEARVARAGAEVDVGTHLTSDELRRLLGLMALSQLASAQ